MYGKIIPVPRWSQTYGRDYPYSGTVHKALSIPDSLAPLLAWSKRNVPRLNGLLVNWYDGALGHKIGAHRDGEKELIAGVPIVTISFGEERIFRLRRYKGKDVQDIQVTDNTALVIPYDTNMTFTHEVPACKRLLGRRISVTIRAFQ